MIESIARASDIEPYFSKQIILFIFKMYSFNCINTQDLVKYVMQS